MRGGQDRATHSREETEGRGVVKDEGQRWRDVRGLCESLSESDGSLHLPLSSRRTNYKVMDSRLITSGFKLAGWWCRVRFDGEGTGEEGRGGDVGKEELKHVL